MSKCVIIKDNHVDLLTDNLWVTLKKLLTKII